MIVDIFGVVIVACLAGNHAACHNVYVPFDCQTKEDRQATVPYLVDQWSVDHPDSWIKSYRTKAFSKSSPDML